MSSSKLDDQHLDLDDVSEIELTLLTLKKPTELKKVVDSVPKPPSAVPKNGLPIWYKLGLECKLPVPKMPAGKIVFSRGKVGEDVRRVGLGPDCPRPSFDLTDPYCHTVSYDYVPMHDAHLAHHFSQKPTRNRMKQLGYVTRDNRAVCSLKEFNQYRKYLYNRFMDRIHMEMVKLDERARDDLTLKKVNDHVARRLQVFLRSEKAREHLERVSKMQCDEFTEKLRLAKQQEKKVQQRLQYLIEFKEKQRRERIAKALEKENRIKQRVQTAAEMELRRRITMVRQWRSSEKKRINRLKQEKEAREARVEKEANLKWAHRVQVQNQKIQEEALLLKLYTEDMAHGARRRAKKAEIYAYNTDLHLQRIKLENWKAIHGSKQKEQRLVRKMGFEFEKSKRGVKGMSSEVAQKMAAEAMSTAVSNVGDPLMTLGQARARMDIQTLLPPAPIKILENILETAIMVFLRRRIHLLLRDVERAVHTKAANVFFHQYRPSVSSSSRSRQPRWSVQLTAQLTRQYATVRGSSICFGEITKISPDEPEAEIDFKSAKDRPPTPVPSLTKLAEVTFTDRVEDLPEPVTMARWLPERRKLLDMVNTSAKLLAKATSQRVQKGMDVTVGKVTLPHMKHMMEWGEAVESMADAVVNNRINPDCADLRRCSMFLTYRILYALQMEMREERKRRSRSQQSSTAGDTVLQGSYEHFAGKDFYVPGQVKGLEVLVDKEPEVLSSIKKRTAE